MVTDFYSYPTSCRFRNSSASRRLLDRREKIRPFDEILLKLMSKECRTSTARWSRSTCETSLTAWRQIHRIRLRLTPCPCETRIGERWSSGCWPCIALAATQFFDIVEKGSTSAARDPRSDRRRGTSEACSRIQRTCIVNTRATPAQLRAGVLDFNPLCGRVTLTTGTRSSLRSRTECRARE